jgi:ribonuclease HI
MSNLVAYVDGGSLGNPGPAGIGVVIEGSQAGKIRIAKRIGRQDNNVAEYVALLEALQCALTLRAKTLHVYSDSQVVVKQMSGEYARRSPRLYLYTGSVASWPARSTSRSRTHPATTTPRPTVWQVPQSASKLQSGRAYRLRAFSSTK